MRLVHSTGATSAVAGVLLVMAISAIAPGVDPEPFPYQHTLVLNMSAVDPEPFPWQANDRVKVRYPWLTPDTGSNA